MIGPFTCRGPVRGSCGHRHRTLATALACLKSDQRGCGSVGGYSDRDVVRCDGDPLDWDAVRWIDYVNDQ